MHLPFLGEKIAELGMRGYCWVAQITVGFLLIGEVSEEGENLPNQETSPPIPKPELPDWAAGDAKLGRPGESRLAIPDCVWKRPPQVERGRLEGPREPSRDAALAQQGGPIRGNSFVRFEVLEGEKFRGAGVLERSPTSRTAQVLRPVNAPHGVTCLRHQIA